MRRLYTILLMVSFTVLLPGALRAQTYAAVEIGIVIPEIMVLQPAASPALNFNFNSSTALENGITITGTQIRYYSNKSYFVTVQASSPFFSGGQGTMPVSVLKYKNSQSTTFSALTGNPQPLIGTQGGKLTRGTGTFGIDFRMDPGYLYPPADNYSVTIIYTISNQ